MSRLNPPYRADQVGSLLRPKSVLDARQQPNRQCGFSSTVERNALAEEEQWRKLELVVNTARTVWKE